MGKGGRERPLEFHERQNRERSTVRQPLLPRILGSYATVSAALTFHSRVISCGRERRILSNRRNDGEKAKGGKNHSARKKRRKEGRKKTKWTGARNPTQRYCNRNRSVSGACKTCVSRQIDTVAGCLQP